MVEDEDKHDITKDEILEDGDIIDTDLDGEIPIPPDATPERIEEIKQFREWRKEKMKEGQYWWVGVDHLPIHMDRPGHLGIDDIRDIRKRYGWKVKKKNDLPKKKVFLQTVEEVNLSDDDTQNPDMVEEVLRRRVEVKDYT